MKPRAVIAGILLVVAGCSSPPITVPALTEADINELKALANYPHLAYRLEPGDTIQIRYTHHPEMAQDEVIPPDGKITVKLAGEVDVVGKTTEELEKLLEEKTSTQLKNPDAVVSIVKFSEKLVYVGGEVGRPGTFPYRRGLTPLQAVAASGGFRDTARVDSVILVRTGGQDNKFVARKLNLETVVTDGVKEPLALAPHDILFVPRTDVADANIWVRQHIGDMVPLFRGVGVNGSANNL